MKMQIIDENTIKVVLTKKDFQIRNIDIKRFKPGSTIYRQLVLEIMLQAAHELNFKADDCRVVVEGHVSKPNEITLLITKLVAGQPFKPAEGEQFDDPHDTKAASNLDRLSSMMNSLAEMAAALGSASEEEAAPVPCFPSDIIISFSDFEKMIELLHRFPELKNVASSLYEHNDSYFLVLKVYARNAKLVVKFRNLAVEYDGVQLPADTFIPILQEHGSLIIKKGAVPMLLRKFNI
ncbi:MAG: adaptor protein MecA [Clostridia bacterium]|nr:adaptor protein MecA [Clostridia bacterium]